MEDVTHFSQKCYDRLVLCVDKFESELELLKKDIATNDVVTRLRNDLTAEVDVPLNVKGVERAETSLACALALSPKRAHNFEATKLLNKQIEQNGSQTDICHLWIAIARLNLGEFRESRLWCERLLLRRPDEILARKVLELVRRRVMRDGLSGLGIVVAVAVISAIAGNLFARVRANSA
jgi:hypothetical protein